MNMPSLLLHNQREPHVKVPVNERALTLELLLLSARLSIDANLANRIKDLLRERIDWTYLIETANQHRVLPLLYRTLTRIDERAVPREKLSQLQRLFHANARRNLFLAGELLQILDLLAAHDIPVIPYKGPVLATSVYGDLSFRQISDLDIVVPIQDVPTARELLIRRGYRPEKEITLEELLKSEKDLTLLWDDRGINFELHWGITSERDPIQIPPSRLWEQPTKISFSGSTVLWPQPEDLLLILCIHGAKHRWVRLGWLCDIAEMARVHEKMNWALVFENASRVGGCRILLLGLLLARDLLGAHLPERISQAVNADSALSPLSIQVKEWLFSAGTDQPSLGEVENYFLRLRESPLDRFRTGLRLAKQSLALTSEDRKSLRVSGFLSYILYPLRPIRLARQYGLDPFRRFIKGIFQR